MTKLSEQLRAIGEEEMYSFPATTYKTTQKAAMLLDHCETTLNYIVCGRGMFGVDPQEDLKWAMSECERLLGKLRGDAA